TPSLDFGLARRNVYRQLGCRRHSRSLPRRIRGACRQSGRLRPAPERAACAGVCRIAPGGGDDRDAAAGTGDCEGGELGVMTVPERFANYVTMEIPAKPENVAFARAAAAMFASQLDFTLD